MNDREDSLQISYGPAKRAVGTMGQGFLSGLAVAGVGILQLIGVFCAFAFAALMYWISDLAYDVTWLLGFPIRLMALVSLLGAVFAAIGAVFKMIAVVVFLLWALGRHAFGRA